MAILQVSPSAGHQCNCHRIADQQAYRQTGTARKQEAAAAAHPVKSRPAAGPAAASQDPVL